jgi:ATP-dependent DNA helicase RecG
MNNPEWEPLEQQQLNTNRIVPVYPLTANITQRWLRRLLYEVVSYWAPRFLDPLPENIRKDSRLMDLSTALLQVHFPDSWDLLNAARQRLAFDEILFLQLGVLRQKFAWQSRSARKFTADDSWLQGQVERLPYELTGAQQRTLQDLRSDLASGQPMNRLLQGDVGSGKTVMAALAIALVTQTGAQAAVMAPTSILAEQHYKTLLQLLCAEAHKLETPPEEEAALQPASAVDPGLSLDQVEPPDGETYDSEVLSENVVDLQHSPPAEPVLSKEQVRLLIGSTPEAEKAEIRSGLASGTIKLVVGTHALLEDPVGFADLQLAIIDEQHRFGVEQRAALRSKGENLHLLVMTATPIPRSLALTVYGDLDVTVLDEMPPGRQEIATYLLEPRERERAYQLVRHQVALGRQAFIIYPLVAESETSEAKAAVEEQARLQEQIFPDLRVGLLHGRLRPEEKDAVMEQFRSGEYHVLVSTSVVEVGVDIPNATLMIIEGANRFGLAQLHQFRGRVGRGADKSYCLLIPDASEAVENERLKVMVETNDGFILAEKDLQQRGPGQFLGTRQSGFNELRMASLTDVQLIEKARRVAQAINLEDPELASSEHQVLAQSLSRFWTVSNPVESPAGEVFPAADIS